MTTTTKQIRAALDAATPAPWWDESGVIHAKADNWTEECHRCDHVCRVNEESDRSSVDNASLIANAPAWLAWLIGEVARRDALLRVVRECHDISVGHECECNWCAEARKEIKG